MTTATIQAPPKLGTADAAAYIGAEPSTLETWRCIGGGPTFLKTGRRVWYLVSDLDEYIARRRVTSTAQVLDD